MKASAMSNKRLVALESHAHAMTEALIRLVEHASAVTLVSAAAMALLEPEDRARVREAALAALGDGPAVTGAGALIEAITQHTGEAQAELQAAVTDALAARPARLQ